MIHGPGTERLQVGTAIWHCDPNAIVCRNGDHLMAFYEHGYRADLRRMSGHAFLQCLRCDPHEYFFALFSSHPSPMVTCYALSKDSYDEWDRSPEPTPPTPELLYRLKDPEGRSYNPYYRPPSSKR